MSATNDKQNEREAPVTPGWQDLLGRAQAILRFANVRVPRSIFLHRLSELILETTACDRLDLTRMQDGIFQYHWRAVRHSDGDINDVSSTCDAATHSATGFPRDDDDGFEPIRQLVLFGQVASPATHFTRNGSFWSNQPAADLATLSSGVDDASSAQPPRLVDCGSIAIIRFEIEEGNPGLLELRSRAPDHFTCEQIGYYECLAQFIGIAIADRRARTSLRQRVLELTFLNDIAQIERLEDVELATALASVAGLLPSVFHPQRDVEGWITYDGRSYGKRELQSHDRVLAAGLVVDGELRGKVEVACPDDGVEIDFESWQREGQQRLETTARQIATMLERQQAHFDRLRLEDQLRHADRLATIGQLAAGVAHELNEPLANILGFAQLIAKEEALSKQAARDTEKIVHAAMHGREVVKKLLLFARQMPARKEAIDLNGVIEDGLYILEARCAQEGIEPVRLLATDLPPVHADRSQLQQVLVNLVVNAIHATDSGGRIFIQTCTDSETVTLSVEDTGAGMSEEVRKQIFLPFFTTKDIGDGTGLGLSVVHGIVSAHGGTISVTSEVGNGSRFDVTLPLDGRTTESE